MRGVRGRYLILLCIEIKDPENEVHGILLRNNEAQMSVRVCSGPKPVLFLLHLAEAYPEELLRISPGSFSSGEQ